MKKVKAHKKDRYVKWISLDTNLLIKIDGITGAGIIINQQTDKMNEKMDEEQSSGI